MSRTPTPGTRPAAAGRTTTLRVAGMTCRACETRMDKALRAVPGVVRARASALRGRVEIVCDRPVDPRELQHAVERAGYVLGTDRRPWLSRDRSAWADLTAATAVVLLLVLAWRALGAERAGDWLGPAAMNGGLVVVLLLGVAASVSTCMALVGGIVMALAARYAAAHPEAGAGRRMRPLLLFTGGRVLSFAALGALMGAIGGGLALSGTALGVTMVVVAAVTGLIGARLTEVSPRLSALSPTLPPVLTRWMVRRSEAGGATATEGTAASDGGTALGRGTAPGRGGYRDSRAALLGAGSFFLPCGFTQAVQVYALSTGSPVRAGLIMGVFAVGTAPGLIGIGSLPALARGRGTRHVLRSLGVVVLAFSAVTLMGGIALVSGGAGLGGAPEATQRSENVTDEDGVQVVRLDIEADGYSPQHTVVYAGTAVRWELTPRGLGCASLIDASSLGVDELIFPTAETLTVDLAPQEPGRYDFGCAMDMFHGSITVIEPPGDGTPPPDDTRASAAGRAAGAAGGSQEAMDPGAAEPGTGLLSVDGAARGRMLGA